MSIILSMYLVGAASITVPVERAEGHDQALMCRLVGGICSEDAAREFADVAMVARSGRLVSASMSGDRTEHPIVIPVLREHVAAVKVDRSIEIVGSDQAAKVCQAD